MNNEGWVMISDSEGRDAAEVRDLLVSAGFAVEIGVCVKADKVEEALRVLNRMEEDADPSATLDLETIAVFHGIDGEMEATAVQGLLEQNGISVVSEGAFGLPSLPYEIKVARSLAASAREILARAQAEGPAAAEAEGGAAADARIAAGADTSGI